VPASSYTDDGLTVFANNRDAMVDVAGMELTTAGDVLLAEKWGLLTIALMPANMHFECPLWPSLK